MSKIVQIKVLTAYGNIPLTDVMLETIDSTQRVYPEWKHFRGKEDSERLDMVELVDALFTRNGKNDTLKSGSIYDTEFNHPVTLSQEAYNAVTYHIRNTENVKVLFSVM